MYFAPPKSSIVATGLRRSSKNISNKITLVVFRQWFNWWRTGVVPAQHRHGLWTSWRFVYSSRRKRCR